MGLTGLMRPVNPIQDARGATRSREGQTPRGFIFMRDLLFDICHYCGNRLMFTKHALIIKI